MKAVDDFFNRPNFSGNAKKISEYARWAIRCDGPAVWKTPTPMRIDFSPGTNGYVVRILVPYLFF
jgi:hypothetical protein